MLVKFPNILKTAMYFFFLCKDFKKCKNETKLIVQRRFDI